MTKIFAWVNSDLDGVGSTILLGNIFKNLEYKGVFFGEFEKEFMKWREDNYENYDKIFVVGMVLDQSLVNKLDDKKIIIVSDRNESFKSYDSTLFLEDSSSCSKMIYKKFKDKANFSPELKKLVLYIDDYNSYALKTKEAEYINALYRKSGSRKFYNLVNRFWNGFDGFSDREVTIANQFFEEIDKELAGLDLYKGTFKGWNVIATFSKLSVNEIAGALLKEMQPDVVIVVNMDTKFVSFRKKEGSAADIVFMAENLCGGGGGEYASGGKLSQKFIEFTQELIPV